MALFNRRKDAQVEVQVPAEIQDYYQAERRERTGIAWLLALGTLVVTLLLAVGLFFGSRWVYRKATHKNPTQTASTSNTSQSTTDSSSSSSDQTSSANSTSSTPATTPVTTTPATGSSGSSTSTTATSSSSISKSSSGLPNTGPGNILAVFGIVSTLGAFAHYLVIGRRRSSRI